MSPTLEISEILECIVLFKTFPMTHGWLKIGLLPGSLGLQIAPHSAIFVSIHLITVKKVRLFNHCSLSAILEVTSLGCLHHLLDFQQEVIDIQHVALVSLSTVLSGCSIKCMNLHRAPSGSCRRVFSTFLRFPNESICGAVMITVICGTHMICIVKYI